MVKFKWVEHLLHLSVLAPDSQEKIEVELSVEIQGGNLPFVSLSCEMMIKYIRGKKLRPN